MAKQIKGWKLTVGYRQFLFKSVDDCEYIANKLMANYVPDELDRDIDIDIEAVIETVTDDKPQEELEAENNGYSV